MTKNHCMLTNCGEEKKEQFRPKSNVLFIFFVIFSFYHFDMPSWALGVSLCMLQQLKQDSLVVCQWKFYLELSFQGFCFFFCCCFFARISSSDRRLTGTVGCLICSFGHRLKIYLSFLCVSFYHFPKKTNLIHVKFIHYIQNTKKKY